MISAFPPFPSSKLLVHVTFYFVGDRIKYLETVVKNFQSYEFSKIDIIIDTNSKEALSCLSFENVNPRTTIKFKVHKNLLHPYLLTWQHRANMSAAINDYDYFMYLEDDIHIPFKALQRWRQDSDLLYPEGYLRGFLRVEKNKNGVLISADQCKRAKVWNLVRVKNSIFYFPHVPYQAFWICDHQQMIDFINSPAWQNDNSDWCIRERAASGMTQLLRKNHKNQKHNCLIPLDQNDQIPEDVLVYHLPNNYIDTPKYRGAKFSVGELMDLGLLAKIYKNYLKSSIPSEGSLR